MKQTTVRIDQATHSLLKDISSAEGISMQAVIRDAVEQHRRQRFLEAVNRGYAALRADPAASASYDQELQGWEMTLADGLENDEPSAPRAAHATRRRQAKRKKRP